MNTFPRTLVSVRAPPIKCQGIKTDLVPFIASQVKWDGGGKWIEPFLGSGAVALNIKPDRALLCDHNPHIIRFYQALQKGEITTQQVREFLEVEGSLLREVGERHYYAVRERFNREYNPLDFLFLNRACFNGLMRFNRSGKFNTPFCRKPERFSPAYITRIVNQVQTTADTLADRDWEFRVCDWRQCLMSANAPDFLYLDPPYIGRHAEYFSTWTTEDAQTLSEVLRGVSCGFALSMWESNPHRKNEYLETFSGWTVKVTTDHFYHVGSHLDLRNPVVEALLLSPTPPDSASGSTI